MDFISDPVKVLSSLFVISYMLSVGLETARGKIIAEVKDSKLIPYALLANLVMVPAAAWILTLLMDLPQDIKTGFLLLAIAPGGLFALNFARVSHANIPLAVGLVFLLSLIGIILTPLLAHFFLGGASFDRVHRLIFLLLLLILLPILAGKLISKSLAPPVALKMAKVIGIISILLFVAVTLLTAKVKSPAIKTIGSGGIVFIVLLVIFSWITGWLLGGQDVRNKLVMAISTSLRNVGVCIPIALQEFSGTDVIVPLLAFSGISIPMNFLFTIASKFILHGHKEKIVPEHQESISSD